MALSFQVLTIAHLFGISVHVNHHKKLERYKFAVLELFTMITLATIKHC